MALASIASKTGSKSPDDELLIRSTSEVAVCCSRASFSSRVSRATSASGIGADEDTALDTSRRFVFSALRRRDLDVSRPALERLFIASPRRLRGIVAGLRPAPKVAYSCPSNKPLCRQLVQQRLRLLQIERVEAFRKPAVNRSEQFASLLRLAMVAPEARHTHCGTEFPRFCLLRACDRECALEISLRFRRIRLRRNQRDLAGHSVDI